MNKYPLSRILALLLIIITTKISSQDFNLFNPSSELYLFSAFDEGAAGFKYNPAVLGLKHKFNAAATLFLQNTRNKAQIGEFDLMLNPGNFGLSYRYTMPWDYQNVKFNSTLPTDEQHTYSLGFGFGSKKISGGLILELLYSTYFSSPLYIEESKTTPRFGFGVLYRPANYLSASFVYRNAYSFRAHDQMSGLYTFGAAFRPFFTDNVTLLAELNLLPTNGLDVNNYTYKFGIEGKPYKGITLRAVYNRFNHDDSNTDLFNLGISFDFTHASLSYNNPFVRGKNSTGNNIYLSQGNGVSISYFAEKKKSLVPERKKVIEVVISGSLQDFNTEDVFFGILGEGKRSVHEVIADIDYAAADPSVKGMLLKIYPVASGRFGINAAIEELTYALERFKKKGKNITAYLAPGSGVDLAGQSEYYIATFADDIVIPPEALLFYGLSMEVFNYRQFLEKYGIELQTFYAGEYKLTFQGMLDSTSEKGKEVINRVLDVVYDKMMSRIVTARNLSMDDYLRSKLSSPITGIEAQRLGLVDKTGWYEDAKDISERNTKTRNVTGWINRNEWDYGWGEEDQIAIIGVYGTIKPRESEAPSPLRLPIPYFGGGRATGSETVVRQLEDAFANPKVKVIILRVDSGGGSAVASSEINDAIIRLKKKYRKPFIVSMGNAAASGGYFVSLNADKIFSDETTITGSIGVWAAIPNLDSLVKSQKIKVEIFKRGENSDIGSFFRKLDEEDVEIIQGLIDFYYDRFVQAVSEGRKIPKEEAEEIAKGRVWMGSDAYNNRLVDEIGGLYSAIVYAKKVAKLDKRYKLVYYAVPGGSKVDQLITGSIVEYIQANLLSMLGIGDDERGIEIKY